MVLLVQFQPISPRLLYKKNIGKRSSFITGLLTRWTWVRFPPYPIMGYVAQWLSTENTSRQFKKVIIRHKKFLLKVRELCVVGSNPTSPANLLFILGSSSIGRATVFYYFSPINIYENKER